jgi:hypothetical protein
MKGDYPIKVLEIASLMGTSDHLREVGTAGSMDITSRRVAFSSRLLGNPPKRTLTVLSGY